MNLFSVDDRVIPIWNVMGVIPGHIKDEVVFVGNHRDGEGSMHSCSDVSLLTQL